MLTLKVFLFVSFSSLVFCHFDSKKVRYWVMPYSLHNYDNIDMEGRTCGVNCTVNVRFCMLWISPDAIDKDDNLTKIIAKIDAPKICKDYGLQDLVVTSGWDFGDLQLTKGPKDSHYHVHFDEDYFKTEHGWFRLPLYLDVHKWDPNGYFLLMVDVDHMITEMNQYNQQVKKRVPVGRMDRLFSNEDLSIEIGGKFIEGRQYSFIRTDPDQEEIGKIIPQLSFQVEVGLTCQSLYFGCDCDIFCYSNANYTCDYDTGAKICTTNHYGENCDKYCVVTVEGGYCDDDGNFKCGQGYISKTDTSKFMGKDCIRRDCKHHTSNCGQKECCGLNYYNKTTNGFFLCVDDYNECPAV